MENEKKMITLKSSDDVPFVVEEAVTGEILAKVVEYCEKHVVVAVDGGDASSSGDDLKKWDDKFIAEMDLSTAYNLITAANYLDIKGLLDLMCQRVADVIAACKDDKEIRATFGIENDFTAEEEAEVLKENQWAFD